jgi:uncharacterized surface protein with fasciclin (FAS1) repeats
MCRKANWFAAALTVAVVGTGVVSWWPQQTVLADHHEGDMKKRDIIDTATGPGMQKVTTVVAAIKAAGLVDTLKGDGPFTVFAPTNDAFDKLPKGTVEELLKPENKEKLTAILTYHVHSGKAIMAKDVMTMKLSTVNGKDINVKVNGGKVWLNDATVIKTDVVCTNGVIHWIDTVLMPPAEK